MYFYTAYGYSFQSQVELPGYLSTSQCEPDVLVRGHLEERSSPVENPSFSPISISEIVGGFSVVWGGVGRYDVVGGRDITITPDHKAVCEMVLQPFYSIIIAALLFQRSHFIFHGSCVEFAGKAIILIGDKGYGKSTLALSMMQQGCRLLSDDVTGLVFDENSTVPMVLPGVANVKIWPEAAEVIGVSKDLLAPLNPYIDKKQYHVPLESFQKDTIPLGAIIILGQGARHELTPLTGIALMKHLLANHYFSRYSALLSPQERKEVFLQAERMEKAVPILEFTRPHDLSLLADSSRVLKEFVVKSVK